jgi:hypothetical protein
LLLELKRHRKLQKYKSPKKTFFWFYTLFPFPVESCNRRVVLIT